jgi:8-oxo-dGTP pyrophosphatase MutT (NUDIX family)
MVLRDGPGGLEVLMLERHLDSDFVGGAYVFPGGKLDASDQLDDALWVGIDPAVEAERMNVAPEAALSLYVAAVRETFEEGGLLFATRSGLTLTATDLAADSFAGARERLNSRDTRWDWTEWLLAEGLVLDLGALAWWSWWATPMGVHRRFDTRFFVAVAPGDQQAGHDNVETVHSVWTRPRAALAAAEEGRATVILPTRKNLEQLDVHQTAQDALEWSRSQTPQRIEPEIVSESGRVVVRHESFGSTEQM